jgi:hypothetical protein
MSKSYSSQLSEISDLVYLSLFFIQCAFITIKLKFKLDHAALITIACYLGAFISKAAGNYIFEAST